ncbi:6055_t:CDS:1, partial [Ambispora leptoticha]
HTKCSSKLDKGSNKQRLQHNNTRRFQLRLHKTVQQEPTDIPDNETERSRKYYTTLQHNRANLKKTR